MSRYLYKTDEIKACINNLYDQGARGNSNRYNGMSVLDEEHLTALLIQATPFVDLPSVHDLDPHQGIFLMIAKYIDSANPDAAIELADYLKNLFVDYFQDTIERMMEERADDDRVFEKKQQELDREREIAAFDKQRI